MERCTAVSSDARRCLRPEHAASTKHLVGRTADASTLQRVAEAWGYDSEDAAMVASGAIDGAQEGGGQVALDDFAELCGLMLEAVEGAVESGNRRAWPGS